MSVGLWKVEWKHINNKGIDDEDVDFCETHIPQDENNLFYIEEDKLEEIIASLTDEEKEKHKNLLEALATEAYLRGGFSFDIRS